MSDSKKSVTSFSDDGSSVRITGSGIRSLAQVAVIALLTIAIIRITNSGRPVNFEGFLNWIGIAPMIPQDWLSWNFYDFNNLLPSFLGWLAAILNILSLPLAFNIWFVTLCWNFWTFAVWVLLFLFGM